ncbi:phosphopantetheine-binding protein [Paenibacillus sp. SYP-B4298]|uniref:phosphopantetheine-binding protein n=1 Tax=Paenibacillus sp. SYP-B4298 TaxID=2996034 RepID=UPI0022DD8BB8|nr:phosphopantetheine-binding protein [Paenibacillus sp. SYP-B4298]
MSVPINEAAIHKTLLEAIQEHQLFEVDVEHIQPEDNLIDYGLDSIGFIKIIILLEKLYHIHFDSDVTLLENFNTLDKIGKQVMIRIAKA